MPEESKYQQTAPTQPPQVKSGLNWLHILIGVAAGMLLLGGGFFAYDAYSSKPKETPTQTPTTKTATNSATKNETADWKVYTNSKYKYSMKYPKEINVLNQVISTGATTADISDTKDSGIVAFTNWKPRKSFEKGQLNISYSSKEDTSVIIEVNKKDNTSGDLEEIAQKTYGLNKKSAKEISSLDKTDVAGSTAFRYTFSGSNSYHTSSGYVLFENKSLTILITETNGNIFEIVYRPSTLAEEIISTFKFL